MSITVIDTENILLKFTQQIDARFLPDLAEERLWFIWK